MRGKAITLILILVTMAAILSGCCRPGAKPVTGKRALAEQARVAANNRQNDSKFATDGRYLYCSGRDDGLVSFNKIIKVNLDDFSIKSTYETTMSYGEAFSPYNLVCVNDTLYYYKYSDAHPVLFSLDTGLTQSEELPFSWHFQTDGEYYYVSNCWGFSEPGIFRVAISDIGENRMNDKSIFTKISDLYASNLIMQGEYLYFYSSEFILNGETISEYGWWRIDLDGSNPIKLSENRPKYFIVAEDRVYSVEEENCIYSMNLDGSDRKVLAEAYIAAENPLTSINTAGDYIFYTYAENGTLHRVNVDGTNDIQLNNCHTTNIVIAGDWVIYKNDDDWNFYKMHFDGTNHCLISEVLTDEEPTEETELSEPIVKTEPVKQTQG